MQYLAQAPRGVVLERLYDDERPNDTGIYGSFAQKPNLIGIPWVLRVWKRNLTELPGLMSQINSFFAGTHPQAARFLLDHDSPLRRMVGAGRKGSRKVAIDHGVHRHPLSLDGILREHPIPMSDSGFAAERHHRVSAV